MYYLLFFITIIYFYSKGYDMNPTHHNEAQCCHDTHHHEQSPHNHIHYGEVFLIASLIAIFGVCLLFIYTPSLATLPFVSEITLAVLFVVYLCAGKPMFSTFWHNCKNKVFFDEHTLMLFATIAAWCIGEASEAVAVLLFFRVGEFLESLAVQRSQNSISALLQVIPDIAHKKENHTLIDLHPQSLEIGDTLIIKVGEKIPTDSVILKGKSYIDMRSINGESVPVSVKEGDSLMAGAINTSAMLEVRVERLFTDSHIAKIAKLTQEASKNKAKTQKIITSFARVYTPIIFILSLCVALIPPLFNGEWHEWIYRSLVVMMVSCPCALVIAVPLGYFVGIGRASKEGVLCKGAIHLETLCKVKNIIFDKTGTLTRGSFEILKIIPNKGYTEQNLLELAAIAEQNSNHPIATCIKNRLNIAAHIESYEEISGKGVVLMCDRGEIIIGNATLLQERNIAFETQNSAYTIIYIAHNGVYAGYILIGDTLKEHIKEDLQSLQKYGIAHFAILSGDNQSSVDYVAKELGITHAYGHLLPAQKEQKLIELMGQWQGKSAFVGDGINDSIVLRRSDVGISINTGEQGNDISKESADIILQHHSLQGLISAFKIAFHTHRLTWQNISFALISKLFIIILGIVGIANMWLAVFGDVGIALLALLNAMRPPKGKAREKIEN